MRTHELQCVPGFSSHVPGIQIGTYVSADATDEHLQMLQQIGVDWAMLTGLDSDDPATNAANHTAAVYRAHKERFARWGLQIYRVQKADVHNMHEVALNLPGRDEKIAAFLHFIRELGAAGICYNTYGTTATGIWSSPGTVEGRGGITARVYDQATAKGEWNGKVYGSADELFHGREFTEEELWENYEFFIRQVAPVAEEAGVFIGLHPDDPPGGMKLGGVPRTLFGTFAGFQRALTIADSPNIGVCLCLGCWLEAGAELMGASAVEAIRYFGRDNPWGQNKLFKIHFRNVSNPMGKSFEPWQEELLDTGYEDMHLVMQALREVEFDGCVIPDHIPGMLGGETGLGYSIAYMRALIQCVNNEARAGMIPMPRL